MEGWDGHPLGGVHAEEMELTTEFLIRILSHHQPPVCQYQVLKQIHRAPPVRLYPGLHEMGQQGKGAAVVVQDAGALQCPEHTLGRQEEELESRLDVLVGEHMDIHAKEEDCEVFGREE